MLAADFADAKAPVGDLLKRLDEEGFLLFPALIGADEIAAIRAELDPVLEVTPRGRNDFEGFTTKRVYALLRHAPATAILVEHPLLMAACERYLDPNFLLTAHLAIQIFDGETAQGWHIDDGFYQQPMPRKPNGVSAIWALDAFTDDNGATELVPGSHKWGPYPPPAGALETARKAICPPGSLLLFVGNLTHRGADNRGAAPRLAVTTQFCHGWHRQQENMMVAVGEGARDLSPRIQAVLGYSIHPPFMGMVDGLHPLRLIEEAQYVGVRRRGGKQPLG